ncbi:unnamed protein product [Taenia asiatica]|uniref:PH domain-containing protein n=1 Tax=Taenia asiatica TaxID=60517 RepID=A0A0R3WCD2_TAEAS|nr:unnamed protein product [Taenia asiatica]
MGVRVSSCLSVLLICTHRVHCMTSEIYDDNYLWADTLRGNLACMLSFYFSSRYPASLCSAPSASSLQFHVSSTAVSSKIMEHPTKRRRVRFTSASSTFYSCFAGLLSITLHRHHRHHHSRSSCCFLHATLDRLFYVAITQGRKPALLACWNFINGEISAYGTELLSSTSTAAESRVFYLMDVAGLYIFFCDEATALSAWIQRATRSACHLDECRLLSSVSVASQMGKDRAIIPTRFDGDRGRNVSSTSLVRRNCSQKKPSGSRRDRNDPLVAVGIHRVHTSAYANVTFAMEFVLVNVYCFDRALSVFFPLPSGVRLAASYTRASSERRRYCGSGGGQQWQWQREMRQSSLQVGVTCGVPWNATATREKQRIGRLNSCREASAPLPPIPSAGTLSSSRFSSKGEYVYRNNFAASGCDGITRRSDRARMKPDFSDFNADGQVVCNFAKRATRVEFYVNLGLNSLSLLSDGSSAHQATVMVTTVASTSECAFPATNFAVAAHPSAVERVSRPTNHLSHTPCVPRSRQGCSDYGGNRGRISTISSGQPFIRYVFLHPPRLPPFSHILCMGSVHKELIFIDHYQSSSSAQSTHPPSPSRPPPMMTRGRPHGPLEQPRNHFETVMIYDGGSGSGSRSTVRRLEPNYVVLRCGETHTPSRTQIQNHFEANEAVPLAEAVTVCDGGSGSRSTVVRPELNYTVLDFGETHTPSCTHARCGSARQCRFQRQQ